MATIKGFKGLRYTEKAGDLNLLVCPPYDIISDTQREEFVNKNQNNVVRLELPKGENKYKDAGVTLKKWMDEQILKCDEKDSIYVYEMEFDCYGQRKSVKGFVSLVQLEEFSKGIVLPHEETLSKAKTDRFNLMSETFCNFSQIYSLYMDEKGEVYSAIDEISKKSPDMSVVDLENVKHSMWCIDDEQVIGKISNLFEDKKLYIADGHHRYETALNFHKHLCENNISSPNDLSGNIMMMLVDMENEGLVVFPTHRIVRDLEKFDLEDVLEKCNKYFDIKTMTVANKKEVLERAEKELEANYQINKKAFALYSGANTFTIMVLKDNEIIKNMLPNMSDSYCNLDVTVLHSLVLESIFGIDKENMAAQINLTYTKIVDEAIEAVDSKKANCSFILNPTRVSEIRDVALAGEKMPQKSTYFFPKTITGMVMNKFK